MHIKAKYATLIATGIQGLALLISASMYWATLEDLDQSLKNMCYVAAGKDDPPLGQFCLYGGLWKGIAVVLVGIGIMHVIFSALVTWILFLYRFSDPDPGPRLYLDMDDEVHCATDSYLVWIGYRVLSMLVCVNSFGLLFWTRAYSSFYPTVTSLLILASLEFVSLVIFVGSCVFLGVKAVRLRNHYNIGICAC